MCRRTWCLILLAVLIIAVTGCDQPEKMQGTNAREGVLDLRGIDLFGNQTWAMDGEWQFYPHKLLEPGYTQGEFSAYLRVPKSWNNYPKPYGYSDGKGYGTYRLTLLTDPEPSVLAVRLPTISTAYKIWINGEARAEMGRVGVDEDSEMPAQTPHVVTFANENGRTEIVLQVSNFHHQRGGIWGQLDIGNPTAIIEQHTRDAGHNAGLFGSLVIIGLYHIALFALRREEKFTIHFGLLCLTVGVRTIVTDEALLLRWVPSIPWETGFKLEYLTLVLSALTAYMYVNRLFPLDTSRRLRIYVMSVSGLFSSIILLLPPYELSRILPLFQLFIVAIALYLVIVLVKGFIRKREGSVFVLVGVMVFIITVINDILYYMESLHSTDLVPLGLFFFILMQAFIISTRFSKALRSVETVSEQLLELNNHLEDRIEERTVALRKSKEEIEATNIELERLERSRRHLLTNISHDLRTPMTLIQGYLEAMQDGVVQGKEQQDHYVRMMLGKIESLNRLISDLFELSKLESGQVTFDRKKILLRNWIDDIREFYELDIENRGMQLIIIEPETEEIDSSRISVLMDEMRINQALGNLIYNALKHMQPGGLIQLHFAYNPAMEKIILDVRDNGSGIASEDLPFIFDRFYKKDKSRNSAGGGSGIGLAIVKEIIELHDGRVSAKSVPGEGASFRIELPAKEEENTR
ncbi:sensor histidine kinase [Paenibacillus tarimensis]|uniref:sensor histidine kinase n=1 Tax=Paenibacillus tarimensis TaxID=416012 RepID=UPI001F2BD19B|nr:sensor histidine kinase [Paenibacillus tarimensis]MCF2942628.1 sensor histidine kinase [Paenibacillus tarimensis]